MVDRSSDIRLAGMVRPRIVEFGAHLVPHGRWDATVCHQSLGNRGGCISCPTGTAFSAEVVCGTIPSGLLVDHHPGLLADFNVLYADYVI